MGNIFCPDTIGCTIHKALCIAPAIAAFPALFAKRRMRGIAPAVLLAVISNGCKSLGPTSLSHDRYSYSDTMSESWKQQMMLNIVKIRYVDPPIFVDVGQIVAGYSLQTSVNANGQISSATAIQGNSAVFGGSAVYVDRPTITYVPLTGSKFVKGLMTPLSPDSVFFTIQAGSPADAVLIAGIASINGLRNQQSRITGVSPPDPDFLKALGLIRSIQEADALTMRVQLEPEKQSTTYLNFRTQGMPKETVDDVAELRRLLRLSPDTNEYRLTFGPAPANRREIAVISRSIIQIMATMASQVDVPKEDVAKGRASPGWESLDSAAQSGPRLIRIQSSEKKPANGFAVVNYRDHWFWIDDGDLKSKRTFAFMMMLFTLADTGEKENAPLITIPAQ